MLSNGLEHRSRNPESNDPNHPSFIHVSSIGCKRRSRCWGMLRQRSQTKSMQVYSWREVVWLSMTQHSLFSLLTCLRWLRINVFVISLHNHVAQKASNTRQVGLAWPLHTTMGSLRSGQVSVQPGAMILCRKAAPCDSFHGKNMQEYWSPAGARCRDQAEVGIPWHDPRQSFELERVPSDSEATQAGALLQACSSGQTAKARGRSPTKCSTGKPLTITNKSNTYPTRLYSRI